MVSGIKKDVAVLGYNGGQKSFGKVDQVSMYDDGESESQYESQYGNQYESEDDYPDDDIGNRLDVAEPSSATQQPHAHIETAKIPEASALPEAVCTDYARLSPELILQAVEQQGFVPDGRVIALNSYENRVYQIGLDQREPLIAKFYRPQRWTDQQILEEHQLSFELYNNDLPAVAPLLLKQNDGCESSLFSHQGFRFTLFPRRGGRAAELDNLDNLLILGRYLGRMHAVGANQNFKVRPGINVENYGEQSVEYLLRYFLPSDLRLVYESLAQDILNLLQQIYRQAADYQSIRVHGDCHVGNILWREDSPHFVDFDDARQAPAVQDIWMLLSGDRASQQLQLEQILEGYEEFREFNRSELFLIEALRTLRIIHYAAWLARRWSDPAFPRAFPWFNTTRYWSEHILELREQFAALQEAPLGLA